METVIKLNKPIKLRLLTIIIRSVISEDAKFYPQLFLVDALHELWRCYGIKQFMLQKELM